MRDRLYLDRHATLHPMSGSTPEHEIDPATDRAARLMAELETHKTDEPEPAQPMERLGARMIDLFIWGAIGIAAGVLAYFTDIWFFEDTSSRGPGTGKAEPIEPIVAWIGAITAALVVLGLEVIPTARTGQNFAKKKLGLRVLNPEGAAPGYRRAFVRFVVWWAPVTLGVVVWGVTFGSWYGFAALGGSVAALILIPGQIFKTDAGDGLHDQIAGTHVVSER